MAKKKTEKAEKKDEKKQKTLSEAIDALSRKKKIALGLFLAVFVSVSIFAFAFTFIEAVTPEEITEEEYLKLLSLLDGRKWTIKKGDEDIIASSLYSFEPDSAKSKKSGTSLLIVLYSDRQEYTLYFAYRNNRVQGFLGSELYRLYHSVGKNGTGRALTLLSSKNKITLYEE